MCKCGQLFTLDDCEKQGGCNEEGEDFTDISAECPSCKKTYEFFCWGEVEDDEILELLNEHIQGIN